MIRGLKGGVAAVMLWLAAALVLWGCAGPGTEQEQGSGTALRILSGSENQELESILEECARETGVEIQMDYQGSVDIMRELQQGAEGYDAVWPASSIWLSMGDQQHLVKHNESVSLTPVVFGIQSTAADMHSILFACSAPEGTVMQGFGAKMARFYGLPSRGGGSQTDAPVVNAQAGYESMLTCYSAYRHGINLVMEAGGVVASVNATSIDKMICDFEIIRQVKTAFTPLEVNEETLDLTEIKEVGHDGSFLTTDYTLDHFMDLYIPRIGSRNAQSPTYFEDSIDKEVNRLLEAYEAHRPTVDAAVLEQVKSVFADAGVSASRLEAIEAL